MGFAAANGGSASAYHAARWAAYAAMGGAAGALGQLINHAGLRADVAGLAAFLGGTLMVALGLGRAIAFFSRRSQLVDLRRRPRNRLSELLVHVSTTLARRASRLSPRVRAVTLGLTSALLPCGWLWAFVATAAATGSSFAGAVLMSAFWAGTLPVLIGVGFGVDRLVGKLRRHVPVASAVALVAAGLFTIFHRVEVEYSASPSQARFARRGSPISQSSEDTCHRP